MKRDSERKKFYNAKLHKHKKMMNVHLSKELKAKTNIKTRALLPNKGDEVKVARGAYKNKQGKIAKLDYRRHLIYLEGVTRKNARGRDTLIPFHASNLVLITLNISKERKKKFGEDLEKLAKEIKSQETEKKKIEIEKPKTEEQKPTEIKPEIKQENQ